VYFDHLLHNYQSLINHSLAKIQWRSINVSKEEIDSVKTQLSANLQSATPQDNKKTTPKQLSPFERGIIEQIQKQTEKHNLNNVTRTEAYRQIYFAYPELHWAFLAHMVSRNGGWNMTDLKGDLLPHILDSHQTKHFFRFLERSNALIFQDAYPQLLLYIESKKQQKNLSYLLPAFDVSHFMKPFWDAFWTKQNSQLLTIALIINEQHYIEKRVVQHPLFQKYVFDTLAFKAQSLLQLTQVIFPFYPRKIIPFTSTLPRLAGQSVKEFSDLDERINIGKKLYAILFGIKDIHERTLRFAKKMPHTGSRADYWPHLFTKTVHNPNKNMKENRLIACNLKKGSSPFFSPELKEAWGNYEVLPPEKNDWCTDSSAIKYLQQPIEPPNSFDITHSFCLGLKKVELAVLAKEHIQNEITE
jgi:hypothetical protein